MKDNTEQKNAYFKLIAMIAIVLFMVAPMIYKFQYPDISINGDWSRKILVLEHSTNVIHQTENLIENIRNCKKSDSCIDVRITLSNNIIEDIHILKDYAGNEDQWLSLVGQSSYDLIILSLKKSIINNKFEIDEFIEERDKIVDTHNSLKTNIINEISSERELSFLIVIAKSVAGILSIFLLYFISNRRYTRLKESGQEIRKLLINTARTVAAWDETEFSDKLNDTKLNNLERRAYSKIMTMQSELEKHTNQMDLYRSLYSMIGFEIRSITNTLKGGVKILTQDTDDKGIFLATEMTNATLTLEELAENFNRLLSLGESDHAGEIDINKLAGNLATTLANKIKMSHGQFECYIDPTIPPIVFGNQIGLFWMLLLNFSNAIKGFENEKVFLSIRCMSSKDIDMLTICFDFILTNKGDSTLNEIYHKDWKINDDKKRASNISSNLLHGISNHSIDWYTCEGREKLTIVIDAIPHKYSETQKPLDGRTFLMCGDSNLQVDIIAETMSHFGASSDYAPTPNDIFKNIVNSEKYDAFFITDSVPGVDINSFCKTLKSRLDKSKSNTKLLVSVANSELAEGIYQHVDHIFYRPIDNKTFIHKLVESLDKEDSSGFEISKNVLVVEDDAIQQIMLTQLLNDFEIQTDTANTGEEAIEYVKEHQPTIIFMDCIMPGMGGLAATRKIREFEAETNNLNITIIGATALSGNKEKKECIDAGMDYVVSKPYKDDEIFKILQNYLAFQKIS